MPITLDFWAVLVDWRMLFTGVLWTLGLTAVSTVLGLALGIVCCAARTSGPVLVKIVVGAYVELFRNTPFIAQLFFIFFGLPAMGIRLSPAEASILAMVVNLAAYATEIIRAGVEATPRGQREAGESLALSPAQIYLWVVLPPALSRVWPALVSQIIIVMLGSSVCGQISTTELSFMANLIQSRNFRAFEAFIIAAAAYLVLSIFVRFLLNWIGPRLIFGGRT